MSNKKKNLDVEALLHSSIAYNGVGTVNINSIESILLFNFLQLKLKSLYKNKYITLKFYIMHH